MSALDELDNRFMGWVDRYGDNARPRRSFLLFMLRGPILIGAVSGALLAILEFAFTGHLPS
jgi:hypothetical protein